MAKKAAKKVAKRTATSKKASKTVSKAPKAKSVKKVARKTASGKATTASSTLKPTGTKSSKQPQKAKSFDPRSVVSFNDLPEDQDLSLIGLVAPDGNPGGCMEGRTWTYSTDLIAWKVQGGSMVREPALVVCRDVSERRLDSLMDSVSNLDIVTFTAKRPNRSLRPKSYPQPVRFELTRFGRKSVDAELLILKSELQAPVDFKDTVFGTLKLDRQFHTFRTKSAFRGTEMEVSFRTMQTDELKELIQYAKSLWKNRQTWYTNWQTKVYKYYMRQMSGWWEGEYELTEALFYKLLGWPVGVEFSLWNGKPGYRLGGWCEELFTDHGIGATGTTIDDMKVEF